MACLAVGDVVLVFDGTINGPKHKRLICVAGDGWFFRINSRSYFKPHIAITVADNPTCLEHDSYIELRGILDMDIDALERDIAAGDAKVLGRLGVATGRLLKAAVDQAVTLTPAEKARLRVTLAVLP